MAIDSGVHVSLHHHCHKQLIFAKFDLKFFYPPTYERILWHFSEANSDQIKRAVDFFDWQSALIDLDVTSKCPFFKIQSQTLCQILFLTK